VKIDGPFWLCPLLGIEAPSRPLLHLFVLSKPKPCALAPEKVPDRRGTVPRQHLVAPRVVTLDVNFARDGRSFLYAVAPVVKSRFLANSSENPGLP